MVEIGNCWTERPSLFVAPATEPDPEKRALLVLKWILCSLKAELYIGRDANAGIKKPLNAFLGELFFGNWKDDTGATSNVISEQVSHHPPITAVHMWDDEAGIRGTGYARSEMTFNGYISVKHTGHATLHLDKFDEDYLIPMPDATVKGFLAGHLYPELGGTYYIISSTGFTSQIQFSGKGFRSGLKNSVSAKLYRTEDPTKSPIYSVSGQWSGQFSIQNASGEVLETCTPGGTSVAPLLGPEPSEQDPWESRRAWKDVIAALREGDMQGTITAKSKLEVAQRVMRKTEKAAGVIWEPLFFRSVPEEDKIITELAKALRWDFQPERTKGIWKFDAKRAKELKAPFHEGLTPYGEAREVEKLST